jgi:cation:H+ antiporter
MINNLFIFIVALFLVIKGATVSSKYAARLARSFSISAYTVGFIIVAIISILPEAFISINAALKGIPAFGLGTLFGSNVADLTLVFAITIFVANRGLKIESKILKNKKIYPFLLLLPLVLGLDGNYSRLEGMALIIVGLIFYYISLRRGSNDEVSVKKDKSKLKNLFLLLFGLTLLLAGSHFTVSSAVSLASYLGVNPVLIGMLIVGLGTTIPELSFSLQSAKKKDDSLAVGDVLGTVLADATVLVGILALINPFSFPQRIIYITGVFMVLASFVLFNFMKTGRKISRKEALLLFFFWLIFVLVEFIVNK